MALNFMFTTRMCAGREEGDGVGRWSSLCTCASAGTCAGTVTGTGAGTSLAPLLTDERMQMQSSV